MLVINNIESFKHLTYYDGKPYLFSYATQNIVEYVIKFQINDTLKGFVVIYRRPIQAGSILTNDTWHNTYTVELLSIRKKLIWKHRAYEHMLADKDTFFEKFTHRIKEFYVANPNG